MKIVLTHPTGNSNVRAVLTGLAEADMLVEFNTTLSANPNAKWIKMLPNGIHREWLRRTFSIPHEQIWTHPFLELFRLSLPRIGLSHFVRHEFGWASVNAVYKDFDKAAAKRLSLLVESREVDAVYAYEDGALSTFIQAKKLGLKCIYDLPIAYWETGRKLLTEEAERLPEWKNTIGGGIMDSPAKLERKIQELELADVVVGPGRFVMESLPKWASGKQTIMAPFGSPEASVGGKHNTEPEDKKGRPLRVLFAGSMGQRKGLGDLFAAMRLLKRSDVELVVMGAPLAPIEFYLKEFPNFKYEPGRPHEQVLELMRSCDIFCLPSIVEGRALVMQEAMSQGLPLIITPNTGGADLIIEGVTGFLVPIRSPEAIAQKVTWFLENRQEIPKMGKLAQEHAGKYTWNSYRDKIIESLS